MDTLSTTANIIGIIAGIIGILGAICAVIILVVTKETRTLEHRIEQLDKKVTNALESFVDTLLSQPLNPLTEEENKAKDILLSKIKARTITIPEAETLQNLLQKELIEAKKKNDTTIIIAIVAVLLILAFVLSKEK